MTPAEICSLSQASLDKVQALKQKFDAAFELLAISGGKEDLQQLEVLQQEIEVELRSPPIARNVEQISSKTLIYIGALEAGIFQKLPASLEKIYLAFPEIEITFESLQLGNHAAQKLLRLMSEKNVRVSHYANLMLGANDRKSAGPQRPEQVSLVKLRVCDLGLATFRPTTDQIYERIAELGLELCPSVVGPYYCLKYYDEPLGDFLSIGMKQQANPSGHPSIFQVYSGADSSLQLGVASAGPDDGWDPSDQFLFRIRKQT